MNTWICRADRKRSAFYSAMLSIIVSIPCFASEPRTANQPDSWLVLCNLEDQASIDWKDWYLSQWGIPSGSGAESARRR
jgi:hypothetical protein